MKDELKSPEVHDVGVAIVEEQNNEQETIYNAYLLNLKDSQLESCLVASTGYGYKAETEEKIQTSTLRHFLKDVPPKSFMKIEPIMPELFGLNNEYWVSFWLDGIMYDKKFIFLAESIHAKNAVELPLIHKKGVLIK